MKYGHYMFGLDVLGADALMQYTTRRSTTLYTSPTAMMGSVWASGKMLYGSEEIQNGRRRVQMNLGGTDYWVPSGDVSPLLEVYAKPEQPSFVLSDTPSKVATAGPEVPAYDPQYPNTVSYVDSATGKRVVVRTNAEGKTKDWIAPQSGQQSSLGEQKRAAILALALVAGVGVLGLGTTIYLLTKSRWGWAALNFFFFTPAAVTAAEIAAMAAVGNKEKA